jgi:hypothetical protein
MDKIILVDHEEIYRIGVSKTLTCADNFRIVVQRADLESLLSAGRPPRRARCVFVNHDSRLRKPNGPDQKSEEPCCGLAEPGEPSQRFTAHGFRGVIYRGAPGPAFLDCIEDVFRGHSSVQPRR